MVQPDADGDPLGASRVTLVGNVLPVPQAELADARNLYLRAYENSKYWVDFEDFSFYRMEVVDVYYVGGFGVMGWVSASEYIGSPPICPAASCHHPLLSQAQDGALACIRACGTARLP